MTQPAKNAAAARCRIGLVVWDDERAGQLRQQALGVGQAQQLQDAQASGQPLEAEALVQPQQAHDQPEPGQVHEQPAEDQAAQQGLRPRPVAARFERRAQDHLERVHVHARRADRRARVADQAVRLVLEQVGGDRQVAFGQAAGHADASARSFRFVQRQDVRRAGRQAQAAADAGQHVVVFGRQLGVLGAESGRRGHHVAIVRYPFDMQSTLDNEHIAGLLERLRREPALRNWVLTAPTGALATLGVNLDDHELVELLEQIEALDERALPVTARDVMSPNP